MKRIISVLLIAALVISLVPMSFAADTQVISLLGDGTLAVTDATFETHGWQVNKTHTCGYLLDGKKWETATYFNNTYGIYLYFDTADAKAKTAAIDFKVNNDGWYDVVATIGAVIASGGVTYSGHMSVWIDGMLAGQIDTTTGNGDKRLRPMYLTEGTHTFFIALDGTGNTTRYVRCAMSAIKLNPITEDKAKPTSMEFLLSKDKISSGGEAEISAKVTFGTDAKVNLYTESAKAKAYPGAQTSDDTVVLAATNPAIAEGNGNIVFGKKDGTTDVTLTANFVNNGSVSATAPITVEPIYNFAFKDYKAWETSLATNGYYSTATHGNNWEIEKDPTYTPAILYNGDVKTALRIQSTVKYAYLDTRGPFTICFETDAAGTYAVDIEHTAYPGNGMGDVYVNGKYVGTFDDNGNCTVTETVTTSLLAADLVKGKNRITINPIGKRIFPASIQMKKAEAPNLVNVSAEIDKQEIEEGTTAKITMSASAPEGIIYNIKDGLFASSTFKTSYKSSNTAVATVDAEGTVTAVGEGSAVITASAELPSGSFEKTFNVTVPSNEPPAPAEPGEEISGTVTFGFGAEYLHLNNYISAPGYTADSPAQVSVGTKITLTARDSDNSAEKFQYWMISGRFYSAEKEITLTVARNTYVRAVYINEDEIAAGGSKFVYFWDSDKILWNVHVFEGDTLGSSIGKADDITGMRFVGWYLDEETKLTGDTVLTENVTNVVAKYEPLDTEYTVKINGEENKGKYNSSVSVSAPEAFTYWKLGEEKLSFRRAFEFFNYGNAEITSIFDESAKAVPTVVIEKSLGAAFITYDTPAGYERIEAGIIFGPTAEITVNSANSKANAKKTAAFGQFTAKPYDNEQYARGYQIFKKDGIVRVIYTNAIEMN